MVNAIVFVRPRRNFWVSQKIQKVPKRPPKTPKTAKNGCPRERFLEKYLQQNQSHGQTVSPIDKWSMPLHSWDRAASFGCLRKSKKSLKDPPKCRKIVFRRFSVLSKWPTITAWLTFFKRLLFQLTNPTVLYCIVLHCNLLNQYYSEHVLRLLPLTLWFRRRGDRRRRRGNRRRRRGNRR